MCFGVLPACVSMSVLALMELDLETGVRSRHLLLRGEERKKSVLRNEDSLALTCYSKAILQLQTPPC